jgi:hypothetical protein
MMKGAYTPPGCRHEEQSTLRRDALDEGIAELDAGLGVETTPDEMMAELSAKLGLDS